MMQWMTTLRIGIKGGVMHIYWKVKCPNCDKEFWTSSDTVYSSNNFVMCDCGKKFISRLHIIETKRV